MSRSGRQGFAKYAMEIITPSRQDRKVAKQERMGIL